MSTTTLDRELAAAVNWFRQQAQVTPFGEISLRLILHNGKLSRVERETVSKLLPGEGGPNGNRTPS
jgi:hypothetical protein